MPQPANIHRALFEGDPALERRRLGREDFKALREFELQAQKIYNPELHGWALAELEAEQAKIQAQATADMLAKLVAQGVSEDRMDDLRTELEYQFMQAFSWQNLHYIQRITERAQQQ